MAQAEEEKKPEQTEFTVKLVKIDEKEKVKIIREVKNLVANLNLVQACHAAPRAQHEARPHPCPWPMANP
jgi:ribosomal protein L7/L12